MKIKKLVALTFALLLSASMITSVYATEAPGRRNAYFGTIPALVENYSRSVSSRLASCFARPLNNNKKRFGG